MNWIQTLSSSVLPITYFVLNAAAIYIAVKLAVSAASFCFGLLVALFKGKQLE